ncbi:MAG: helix-turn-helix domain-containing protein [Burkholderiales bacterium]|nr:helix-turn-helix domain-containing protein [Burkholderiales bacterium]
MRRALSTSPAATLSPATAPATPQPAGQRAGLTLDVRLLWLPEALPGTLFAALDVLRTAQGLHRLRQPRQAAPLRWRVVGPSGRAIATPFAEPPRRAARGPAPHRLLVVPGLSADDAPHLGEIVERHAAALQLVQQHAASGGWIATCFTGLALPARLGLLDGHRVAGPWPYLSWMRRNYPHCDFSGTEPLGLHGQVFSAVAPPLATELMLRVIAHLLDPDLASACARVLLHQPERQQAVPALAERQWLQRTSDSPVARAMQWLQDHIEHPYHLKELVAASACSERTLLRHFQQATGKTPLQHLQRLRVERAKLLLETTLHGLDAIAEACGYADTASMRRLFRRETGLTMAAHRQRHALRARRPHWKVRRPAR